MQGRTWFAAGVPACRHRAALLATLSAQGISLSMSGAMSEYAFWVVEWDLPSSSLSLALQDGVMRQRQCEAVASAEWNTAVVPSESGGVPFPGVHWSGLRGGTFTWAGAGGSDSVRIFFPSNPFVSVNSLATRRLRREVATSVLSNWIC